MNGCRDCAAAYSCWLVCAEGGAGGPCESGMQGSMAMRSWELWDVCTKRRQDVKQRVDHQL